VTSVKASTAVGRWLV